MQWLGSYLQWFTRSEICQDRFRQQEVQNNPYRNTSQNKDKGTAVSG